MVELRSSIVDRALVVVSPGILVAIGALGVSGGGIATPGGVLLLAGLVLWGFAAWSVPWFARIDRDGIAIRTLVRHRFIPWDDIVALERHRRRPGGPLVVRTVERRRIALATSVEVPSQWDGIREVTREHAAGLALAEPPPSHPFNR